MKGLFTDQNGKPSSKRVFAFLCFIVATAGAFLHVSDTVVLGFLGAATSVFVGQALSKT